MRGRIEQAKAVLAAVSICVVASEVKAFEQESICEGAIEANMQVFGAQQLGPEDNRGRVSGVVLEGYRDPYEKLSSGQYGNRNGTSVASLHDFNGYRAIDCSTGKFVAFDDPSRPGGIGFYSVYGGLAATEFLRDDLKAGRKPSFSSVKRAAEALFGQGNVVTLRETAETCGCWSIFPDLRPNGFTPFDERKDVEFPD